MEEVDSDIYSLTLMFSVVLKSRNDSCNHQVFVHGPQMFKRSHKLMVQRNIDHEMCILHAWLHNLDDE